MHYRECRLTDGHAREGVHHRDSQCLHMHNERPITGCCSVREGVRGTSPLLGPWGEQGVNLQNMNGEGKAANSSNSDNFRKTVDTWAQALDFGIAVALENNVFSW